MKRGNHHSAWLSWAYDFVERGVLEGAELESYLTEFYTHIEKKIDVAVLGCTHYPFVKKTIQNTDLT